MSSTQGPGLAILEGGPLDTIPHCQDLILEAAHQNFDREAVVSLHQPPLRLAGLDDDHEQSSLRWTYRQLERGASHLASQFAASGVQRGSAIAFFCENRAEWVLLCWTSVLFNCPIVPLNPRLA